MTPPFSFGAKTRRLVLIGAGATLVISGFVGALSAWRLIEPSDETAIGITRNEFVGGYTVVVLCGVALVWLGARRPR